MSEKPAGLDNMSEILMALFEKEQGLVEDFDFQVVSEGDILVSKADAQILDWQTYKLMVTDFCENFSEEDKMSFLNCEGLYGSEITDSRHQDLRMFALGLRYNSTSKPTPDFFKRTLGGLRSSVSQLALKRVESNFKLRVVQATLFS